ncbi:phosphopantetheine adenylyltransferase [Roseibium sp. MB-4]
MRSSSFYKTTGHHQVARPFTAKTKAMDPIANFKLASIFILALLTVLIAGIISMNASNASQAQEAGQTAPQGMMATKTDRAVIPAKAANCESQTWGAWSAECAAELTGASKVRTVSYVTIEKQPNTVNQTILARYPSTN